MKWFHSILTLAATAATIFSPQIQHWVAGHADVAASLVAVYAILGHMLPSPVKR